jgi:endonuclease/exonuclease/phosphatase (EEP) superfamily protein YafD
MAWLAPLAAGLFVALSATRFVPDPPWALDLCVHFQFYYLTGLVVCVGLLTWLRRWGWVLLLLVGLYLPVQAVAPGYGPRPAAAVPGHSLKLLLANVLTQNRHYTDFIALIESEQPEVVAVLEANQAWVQALKPLGGAYPYQKLVPREDNFGIALYSRLPLQAVAVRSFGAAGVPSILAEVLHEGITVTLVATHPLPPLSPTHFALRNEHLGTLARELAGLKQPVILAGDLNTTMWSVSYRALEQHTGLRNVRQGFGVLPTWPSGSLGSMLALDHVLVSSAVGVQALKTLRVRGSDHRAVVAVLALPRKE